MDKEYLRGLIDALKFCIVELNETEFVYKDSSGFYIESQSLDVFADKMKTELKKMISLKKYMDKKYLFLMNNLTRKYLSICFGQN